MREKFFNADVKFVKGCDINVVMPAIPTEQLFTADGRHGLSGAYYSNTAISGQPTLVRVDEQLDFDWQLGARRMQNCQRTAFQCAGPVPGRPTIPAIII